MHALILLDSIPTAADPLVAAHMKENTMTIDTDDYIGCDWCDERLPIGDRTRADQHGDAAWVCSRACADWIRQDRPGAYGRVIIMVGPPR